MSTTSNATNVPVSRTHRTPSFLSTTFARLGAWLVLAVVSTGLISSCATTPATTTNGYYSSYTAPYWAPTGQDLSQTRYYYLPDYNTFYDAANGQYIYQNNGSWVTTSSVPANLSNTDLRNSFAVLLSPNTNQPWLNDAFYQTNYPVGYYQAYPDIISSHNMISGLPSGYNAIPRAYNEATDQVVFFGQNTNNGTLGSTAYTVPMSSISVYMPASSQSYRYGAGVRSR